MKNPKVFVTRKLPAPVEARMKELFEATLNAEDRPLTSAQLHAAVKNADILVPTVTDVIDAALINAAGPQLKMIANFGAGVDHIDLLAAKTKGILVTNTPSVLTEDTADIAMALILAAPRRMAEGAGIMRRKEWTGWSPTFLMGHRVAGKKLGLLGMGRIGQAVARRAQGFGLAIHYNKRKRLHESVEQELGATYWDNLDAMLEHIDILSIHCPATAETQHLLSAARLAKMKPESYVINTARGSIIDEAALISALKERRIAGAGLDVYEHEPNINPGFYECPNIVLLPHISSATWEARVEMGEKVIINIRSFMDGHKPKDRVLG